MAIKKRMKATKKKAAPIKKTVSGKKVSRPVMSTKQEEKTKPEETAVLPAKLKKETKSKIAKPTKGFKPAPAKPSRRAKSKPKPRGLIIFGAIVGVVILIAVIGRLRQGPPAKLIPAKVLAAYSLEESTVGPLSSPRGIAVSPDGSIYIADLGNHRVVKLGPDGRVVDTWGQKGKAAGEFNEPSGISVDNQGAIYVADAWNGRIQKFTAQGEYLGEISAKAGNFYSPRSSAVDAKGFIYVADTGNSCIKKFDGDANLVKHWGEYGPGKERFQETFGVCVGPKNRIYVGDAGNRRIKIFTDDGKFIQEIRVKGWQSGVSWPMLAVDSGGRIYAADAQNNMVWIYDAEGKYLGSWGNQPGKEIFASPLSIAIDIQGAVYVSNMTRGEIVKIAPFVKN